jgi:hypothetical protein
MDAAETFVKQMQALNQQQQQQAGETEPVKAGLRARVESRVRMSGTSRTHDMDADYASGMAAAASRPPVSSRISSRPEGGDSEQLPKARVASARDDDGSSDDNDEADEFGDLVGDDDDEEGAADGVDDAGDAAADGGGAAGLPLDSSVDTDATDVLVSDGEVASGGVDDSDLQAAPPSRVPPRFTSAEGLSHGGTAYDPLRYGDYSVGGSRRAPSPRREALDVEEDGDDEDWMRFSDAAAAAAASAPGVNTGVSESPSFAHAFARSFAAAGDLRGAQGGSIGADTEEVISDADLAASIAQLEAEIGSRAGADDETV